MAKQNKTTENETSVPDFISSIKNEKKRLDFSKITDLMTRETGFEPKMWGTAIVGFGSCHYKYESGREGDMPLTGLAARVNSITLYLSSKFDQREELLAKFGKHKSSKACIYIQKLEDIDIAVLAEMIRNSMEHTRKQYPV